MATKIKLQLPKGLDVEIVFVDPPLGAGAEPKADPAVFQPVKEIDPDTLGWNACGCSGGNCSC